jgi:hypothetical protein
MPGAIGRVLSVVRKLIDYGKELASTIQQRAAAPGFALFARSFGTADLAVILARITNGLRRAAALEARLCRRAARGQDLTPTPIRLPATPGPRAARQVAPPDAAPRTPKRQPHRGPASRAPPHGRGNRRRGASSAGRRRHRRYLPRSRHRARPVRPGVLGRTQPGHHHLWRKPRLLSWKSAQAAVRARLR